jgi:hypothetical protein
VNEIVVRPTEAPDLALPVVHQADLLVLPREIDEAGRGLYHDSVLDLVKQLRRDGVNADYLHSRDNRSWIGEKSIGPYVLDFVIGLASNGAWEGITQLLHRIGDKKVRGKVARVRQSDSETVWEWYEVEGDAKGVAEALKELGKSNDD